MKPWSDLSVRPLCGPLCCWEHSHLPSQPRSRPHQRGTPSTGPRSPCRPDSRSQPHTVLCGRPRPSCRPLTLRSESVVPARRAQCPGGGLTPGPPGVDGQGSNPGPSLGSDGALNMQPQFLHLPGRERHVTSVTGCLKDQVTFSMLCAERRQKTMFGLLVIRHHSCLRKGFLSVMGCVYSG